MSIDRSTGYARLTGQILRSRQARRPPARGSLYIRLGRERGAHRSSREMNYRADGPFVILTTIGKDTAAERQVVYDAILSDPNVQDGAYLIIDLRKYAARLTQSELQDRVRALLDTLGTKLAIACAAIVRDGSLRFGLELQLVAGNMIFRVAVFHDEESARRWLVARP